MLDWFIETESSSTREEAWLEVEACIVEEEESEEHDDDDEDDEEDGEDEDEDDDDVDDMDDEDDDDVASAELFVPTSLSLPC